MIQEQSIYLRLEPNGPLPDVSLHAPFKAAIVIDGPYSPEWQEEVSKWLIENGCRYTMAWGPECSSWDDSVDHADMGRFPNYETPEDQFVMTTWHENESLVQVFWFSRFCAEFSYNGERLSQTLIVHVGSQDRKTEMLQLFEQSATLAEREGDES